MPNTVQETRQYNKFNFISSNREQNRGHIEALKQAFQEIGNLTKVQPILVNERMEIIDGQHRYFAAMELGEPIFYTQHPGLGIRDARAMNILHRNWNVLDYAQSYADTNPNYQRYLELREDYGFVHSILLEYLLGVQNKSGVYLDFRNGHFVVDDWEAAEARLARLAEVGVLTPLAKKKSFALAFLQVQKNPAYNHKRMLDKIANYGDNLLKDYNSMADNLHMFEDLYNYRNSENTRVRFF